jgi:hypothetical protein
MVSDILGGLDLDSVNIFVSTKIVTFTEGIDGCYSIFFDTITMPMHYEKLL